MTLVKKWSKTRATTLSERDSISSYFLHLGIFLSLLPSLKGLKPFERGQQNEQDWKFGVYNHHHLSTSLEHM
ncbi:hypothetical protein K7X08_034001 [Anisodus acutangulus]|uniref:Uncharacterized protein n=1 Tax=Anisodus acutangulus TaxID=402998 RepID=A0A9Q1R546_9SOLA|nr:hypothetical protein K7X08_034001 [Anisodus acutangulus]